MAGPYTGDRHQLPRGGAQMQRALAVLAKPEVVEVAREATRRMLADGRITLVPNAERTAVAGLVHLRGLDQQMLEFAGFQRHVRNVVAGAGFGNFRRRIKLLRDA
jgi:hypothetical protein